MKCIHLATVTNNTEVLQMLLDNKADINSLSKDGRTALHFAAEIKSLENVVRFLIENGIDLDAIWEKGIEKVKTSAADVAYEKNNVEVVKLIADRKVL